jgi:hypothetical protein
VTRVAVVVPIGPGRPEEFVVDTVESLTRYLPDARYIVLDDTGIGMGRRLELPDPTVLANPGPPGRNGLLYRRLSIGFEEALKEPFDLLLRLDDDAVVLGNTFVEQALSFFSSRPDVGLLGLHREQYLQDERSFGWPAARLRELLVGRPALSDPERTLRLWKLITKARRDGYRLGEHVLSAVSLWRPEALAAVKRIGILGDDRLVRTGLTEDHIFGLGIRAAGFAMHQFGTANDDQPLAVAWKGLPAAPEEIVAAGKDLAHSTKSFARRDEAEVRATFRRARLAQETTAFRTPPTFPHQPRLAGRSGMRSSHGLYGGWFAKEEAQQRPDQVALGEPLSREAGNPASS